MRSDRNKEIKIGLLFTGALVIVYMGFSFLKGAELFSSNNRYYTVYSHCKGLGISSPVLLNGVSIGRVRDVQIMPNKQHNVLVAFEIKKEVKLTNATKALLISSSLLGEKAINLLIEEGKPLKNHDTVIGQVEQGLGDMLANNKLPAIQQDFKHLSLLTTQFIASLVENTDKINNIFDNVEVVTNQLRESILDNKTKFHTLTDDFFELAGALANRDNGLGPLLTKGNELLQAVGVEEMAEFIIKINHILSGVSEIVDATKQEKSSFGKLLHSDSFYGNLNQTLKSLDELLIDMRQRPWNYVHLSIFGRRHKRSLAKSHKNK